MNPLNVSFLQELLTSVGERGRALLPVSLFSPDRGEDFRPLVDALVSGRGEASGVALAGQLIALYSEASNEVRLAFFCYLAETLRPDSTRVTDAAKAYIDAPDDRSLQNLQASVESPMLEFFRRLNLAPGATAQIVSMRRDLIGLMEVESGLEPVDDALRRLLYSWFNRGFLVLKRIDWQTPASILEKIIAYEAVHEIRGWDDLRRRLEPSDRRCFAFFHPSLVDDPLIFVEVALMETVANAIEPVLNQVQDKKRINEPTTAVFYSISNCQEGLKGISFGHFLLKQVVEELVHEVPSLNTFVTLSPLPRFSKWLHALLLGDEEGVLNAEDRLVLAQTSKDRWFESASEELKATLMVLAAHYSLRAKNSKQRPIDPVARFHLGNGAKLSRINWLGDVSPKGLREAFGLMVNYQYDLDEIEKNHEAFANDGAIAVSRAVRAYLRAPGKKPQGAQSNNVLAPVIQAGDQKVDL